MLLAHTTAASLAIDDVRQVYGSVTALDGVSLYAAPGEILCLLGASGCGKTTLLRIAAGLEQPSSGRVLLAEREVSGPKRFVPPEMRGIGLMFQDYALFPHLTILQNVMFGLRRIERSKAAEIAMRAIERVRLTYHASDYPHMLSGGEQQRAALARALAPNPAVLLMDEPFSNLDQRLREQVREETIALLREKRATAIVVTHDPVEAMQIADRIVLMRHGKVVQAGTPEQLYNQPTSLFAARFFCDQNELPGVVRGGEVSCALGKFPADGLPDGPAVVCIRPQFVALCGCGEAKVGGTVLTTKFLGATRVFSLELPGLDRLVNVSASSCNETGNAGDMIGLKIDPARVLVFPCSHAPDAKCGCVA